MDLKVNVTLFSAFLIIYDKLYVLKLEVNRGLNL